MGYPSIFPTGTLIYDKEKTFNGYTIFPSAKGALLIDMNGREETCEILSEEEMREFDGDIEEPSELEEKYTIKENHDYTLAEEKEFAKAFDNETVCKLSELLGDCFILA